MESLADKLPPEIARQIHPDWRKNEAAYWAVRDQLVAESEGRRRGWFGQELMFPIWVFLDGEEHPCRL